MGDQSILNRTNASGRLLGSYQAKIVGVEHPDGLFMAKVCLLGRWESLDEDDLPWAEFLLPLGAKSEAGHAIPVEVDDYVWVDFPRLGDTRFPRITGSLYYAPDYTSYLPTEITGEGLEPVRADDEPEPPAYSMKDDTYSRFGLMERKTCGGGWILTHRESGSAMEMTESGEMVHHVEGKAYRSSQGLLEQIDGDTTIKITGTTTIEVDGDAEITTTGKTDIYAASDVSVEAGGSMTLTSAGEFTIDAGGSFTVTATNADFNLG